MTEGPKHRWRFTPGEYVGECVKCGAQKRSYPPAFRAKPGLPWRPYGRVWPCIIPAASKAERVTDGSDRV